MILIAALVVFLLAWTCAMALCPPLRHAGHD
jgi:hypothetical protein